MVSEIMHEPVECDKRVRREIANSNERRRMQSINAGFEQLKILLPSMSESDKLSKANILKLTAKYINTLVSRINHLENEVAIVRGSREDSIDSNLAPDYNPILFNKKRNLTDKQHIPSKKRSDVREFSPRRSTLLVQHDSPQSSPTTMPHLSPVSSAPSFINESQNSPDSSEGSNAARLEHLVMAIEKIEGDLGQQQQEGFTNSIPDTSSESSESIQWSYAVSGISQPGLVSMSFVNSTVSSKLPSKPVMMTCNPPVYESDESRMIVPISQSLLLKNVQSSCETPVVSHPLVAKMLNQGSIPHKYLHRPQVIVNSSN